MSKKQATLEQLKAGEKAYKLRTEAQNDNVLCETLGISKVTLYTRLKENNWKKSEIALINALHHD